jgi:hypothetical protein
MQVLVCTNIGQWDSQNHVQKEEERRGFGLQTNKSAYK